jgi:hypothetical protein
MMSDRGGNTTADDRTGSGAGDAAEVVNPLDRPHPLLLLMREHPALAVTSAYAAASFIGVMFSFAFYIELGVNFFNFADISDLLMAVLREPVTLLLFVGGVAVAWMLRSYYRWEWSWFQRHPPRRWLARACCRLSQSNYHSAWSDVVGVIACTFLFITLYGEHKADQVREGRVRQPRSGRVMRKLSRPVTCCHQLSIPATDSIRPRSRVSDT